MPKRSDLVCRYLYILSRIVKHFEFSGSGSCSGGEHCSGSGTASDSGNGKGSGSGSASDSGNDNDKGSGSGYGNYSAFIDRCLQETLRLMKFILWSFILFYTS